LCCHCLPHALGKNGHTVIIEVADIAKPRAVTAHRRIDIDQRYGTLCSNGTQCGIFTM